MPIEVEHLVDVDIEEMKRDERFGKLSERTQKRIRKLPSHLLCRLVLDLLNFKEPSDLTTWLRMRKAKPRGWYFTPEGVAQ